MFIATLIAVSSLWAPATKSSTLYCPITLQPVVKDSKITDWHSIRFSYCCPGCDSQFIKNPTAAIEKAIVAGKTVGTYLLDPITKKPVNSKDARGGYTDYKSIRFYFVNAAEKSTFETNPAKYGNLLGLEASLNPAPTIKTSAEKSELKVTKHRQMKLASKSLSTAEKTNREVKIGSDKKSLIVTGSNALLVVTTGPENDMLSYRILGLRNPAIKVKAGAKLTFLFINSDDDMLHNLRFTAKAPPYKANIGISETVGTNDLSHKSSSNYTSQEVTLTVPKRVGTYYYLCTIPGHAAAGMFGKIVVHH